MQATNLTKERRSGLSAAAGTCKVSGLIFIRNGMEVSLFASQSIDSRLGTFQVSLFSGEKVVA